MKLKARIILSLLAIALPDAARPEADLTGLVKNIQPAVATVVAYDANGNVAGIGTGFFISKEGDFVTNHHVLFGKFDAEIKTANKQTYRVKTVAAQNQATDLLVLKVDIPAERVSWLELSDRPPSIAQHVVVVGSPMGLEQTVSDGIISSVREIPGIGTFYQISAPISPGSSGSPVVDLKGKVVAVATFQFLQGQNLNFAIAGKSIRDMQINPSGQSLSEWTFSQSDQKAVLAEELCRTGFNFSINGQDQKALEYFRKATEEDPASTAAWYGLGYCYAGQNSYNDAIEAYQQAIQTNPTNALSHFHLGNYLHKLGRHDEAIEAFHQAVAVNPEFEEAYFSLGILYFKADRLEQGIEAFQNVARINPESLRAHYHIGLIYAKLGRHAKAIEAYKEAIQIEPDFTEAYYHLGVVYGELGNRRDELQAYKQAIRTNPDFAPAHYTIGQAYLRQGDKAAALDQYKILKRLDESTAAKFFDEIYR